MNQENFNLAIYQALNKKTALPYWVQMIYELGEGAGYSYSRIAQRIGVSPSTIQKLATKHDRTPRHSLFHRLLVLYYKVFYGPYRSPQAEAFIKQKDIQSQEKSMLEMMARITHQNSEK